MKKTNKTQKQILSFIESSTEPKSLTQIQEALPDVAPSTLYRNASQLKDAGWLSFEDGYYSLNAKKKNEPNAEKGTKSWLDMVDPEHFSAMGLSLEIPAEWAAFYDRNPHLRAPKVKP